MTTMRVPRLLALLVVVPVAAGCVSRSALHPTGGSTGRSSGLISVPAPAELAIAVSGGGDKVAADTWKAFPADASLRGPHFTVRVAGSAVLTEVTGELLRNSEMRVPDLPGSGELSTTQALRPAKGYELLLAPLITDGRTAYDDDAQVSYAVLADGVSHPITAGPAVVGRAVLASVPVGAPALLAVTDAGRTQTLDLRTGVRAQTVPLEYPERDGISDGMQDLFLPGTKAANVSTADAYYGLSVHARLLPWSPGKGWAPDGQGWLELDIESTLGVQGHIVVDLGKSLTIRTGAGQAVPVAGTLDLKSPDKGMALVSLVVAVPADTTKLTLTLRSSATVRTTSGSAGAYTRLASYRSSGTVELK